MNDLQFAIRQLLKYPGFTAVVVLTLALGTGANTFVFSFLNRTYFRPLPFADPGKLVEVSLADKERGSNKLTPAQFLHLRDQSQTLSHVAAMHAAGFNITGVDEPASLQGTRVSAGFFDLLHVHPALGRLFHPSEDQPGANAVVIVSHETWQRHLGGKTDVIGRMIQLNRISHEVIGVLPPSFNLPIEAGQANLWVPMRFSAEEISTGGPNLTVIGRHHAEATLVQAQAEADVMNSNLPRSTFVLNSSEGLRVSPLKAHVGRATHTVWTMLTLAGGFVLLIACANVSSLLLARAVSRRKEIAIRLAIGGNRGRFVRQLLTESFSLSALGALGGILLASWGAQVVTGRTGDTVPFDFRVASFTAGILLLTAIACGIFPALLAVRTDLNTSLKDGGIINSKGTGSLRLRQLFVMVQLALSLTLLLGVGLMIRSVAGIFLMETGFAKDGIVSVDVYLPTERYTNEMSRMSFFRRATEEMGQISGVQQASATSSFPIHAPVFSREIFITGSGAASARQGFANINRISENYLDMMKIPLRKGRHFSRDDEGSAKVAIIDETLERRFFAGENPIGRVLTVDADSERRETFTIVGVAANVVNVGSQAELDRPAPILYVPFPQFPPTTMTLLARTGGGGALGPTLRELLRRMDSDLPVRDIRTVEQRIVQVAERNYSVLAVLVVFAACGLGLAAVGVFGVVAYAVAQRTREIGIRMALGAGRRDVRNLFLRQGLMVAVAGTGLGLAGAFILTRGMERLLYGVSATDPITYAVALIFVLGVALLASLVPARRAATVDPMVALKYP